ncbi:unnamed protein product [Moneuplotes crassus]|uniref:histidine kinase n=1 Tax=Euplotes crassus TaxID=5936 RepID=A0AAD2D779_EUPCR|nr:unnamed protein product [Moneuplotes crassus]
MVIVAFILVQLEFLVLLYFSFGEINDFVLIVIIYGCICFVAITVVISYLFKSQIELVYQNKELSETIRYILQVLPEGVLINTFKEDKARVGYANDTIQKQLFENQPLENTFTNSLKLRCRESSDDQIKIEDSESYKRAIKIGELLDQIQHQIDKTQTPVTKQVLIEAADNGHANLQSNFVYTLKSIPVNWDKCNKAYLHVVSDITSLKELEKQKATNQCMQIMFSSVSHEFRTPLNSFANILTLLTMKLTAINDCIAELTIPRKNHEELEECFSSCDKYLKMGNISAKILENLVEDILDFAKIESGVFSLDPEAFLVQDLIDEISYIFQIQCESRGILFEIICDERTRNINFISDMARIRQILMNLVSNSLKFTAEGFIKILITPFKSLDNNRNFGLKFRVSDTGVGISAEDQKNLFKLFGTVDKHKQTLNLKGTGLGLTITQKLVSLLGGNVKLESEEHVGTTIEFSVKEAARIRQGLEESKGDIERSGKLVSKRNHWLPSKLSLGSIYNSQTSEKEFVNNLGYVQDVPSMEINNFTFNSRSMM